MKVSEKPRGGSEGKRGEGREREGRDVGKEEGRKGEREKDTQRHTYTGRVKWSLSFCKLQHRFQVRGNWRDKIKKLSFSWVSPHLLSHEHKSGIFLRAAGNH